jgi:miniconductance mechanosensitive channel
VVSAIFDLFMAKKGVKAQTLKGVAQTIQVIICIFGAILLVSTLINKSPLVLITGLGAMAAVLMLVFQDSIKGLVAGIQLSANDMMRPGDWITLPKCNADGVVIDVTLNTVKVQNYDNTIITIPPYMLVNDSFQNWRGMQEGNGRRITRSVNIDMHSIRFLRPEELQRYQEQGLLPSTAQPGEVTNLQAYRAHLMRYLRLHSGVNSAMTLLVRQLAPTSEGLPLQVYCFSRSKVWAEYEGLQSEIVEYVAASLPQFGLGVYQRVGAYDDYLIGKETLKSEI